MNGYIDDIEKVTKANVNFRKVLYTGKHAQLVAMSLVPGEDIGLEVHDNLDQFFRIEEGEAKVIIDGEEIDVKDDFAIIVPAGSEHNIINTSSTEVLKLYKPSMRSVLAQRIGGRYTTDLRFMYDDIKDKERAINKLLDEVVKDLPEPEGDE